MTFETWIALFEAEFAGGRRPITLRRPTTYASYIADLYGRRSSGWFLFLNYGLLVAVLALGIIVVAALSGFGS